MNHEESKRKEPEGENAAPSADRDLGQSVSTTPEDLRRRRDQRIQDHMGIVLDSSDTLQACMGPILCDILGICQEMKRLLGERISRSPSPTAEVKEFMPLVEMYLKTVRQAERLANVDCRIRESRICRPEE